MTLKQLRYLGYYNEDFSVSLAQKWEFKKLSLAIGSFFILNIGIGPEYCNQCIC